jgi:hypothetical protein
VTCKPLALAATLAITGCIDSYNGSKVEMFLHGGVHVPGTDEGNGQPPADTHYEAYVVKDDAVFKLFEFDIRPVIKRSDPCFIEEPTARFPGLHSTKIVEKLIAAAEADGNVSALEAGDIALAKIRVSNMPGLEGLKVVVSHEPGLTDAAVAQLVSTVPSSELIDDATNADRLRVCQGLWRAHFGYYVGTDKVLTIPLNGIYHGLVAALDPRNMGPLGGGQVDVAVAIPDFDAMRVNWSFNDPNDPRREAMSPSMIGWHYMAGKAVQRTRGVTNVTLVNQDFAQISGEVSVFTQLADDDVHF